MEVRRLFGEDIGRLEYLGDYIFGFVTYDSVVSDLFAEKAIEVSQAINKNRTTEYTRTDGNYLWYLVMVNMPFFREKLDWGTSIRGAWWDYENDLFELSSTGLFMDGKQILTLTFDRNQWIDFIYSLYSFALQEGSQ